MSSTPRLLLVAHGTASATGQADARDLARAVAALRSVPVDLCFLDVVSPRLADVLDDRPTVVVPALLSTGYHVQADIPEAVAGHPDTVVARHLGPHPLLAEALADALPGGPAATTFLVAAGSSRPDAAAEVAAQAELLQARLGHPVRTATVTDDLARLFDDAPQPVDIATYLLARGRFSETIAAAAGSRRLGGPLGAHPSVVALVWARYDEALGAPRSDEPATVVR